MTGRVIRLPRGTKTDDGKVEPKTGYATRNRKRKTDRLAKAWMKKGKKP